jgi:hypothetical protein
MSDVIEQLRLRILTIHGGTADPRQHAWNLTHGDSLMHREAVAEIERLRALIQRVAKFPANVDCAGTLLRDDVMREAGPPETWRA